jgi:hypothetical protein
MYPVRIQETEADGALQEREAEGAALERGGSWNASMCSVPMGDDLNLS